MYRFKAKDLEIKPYLTISDEPYKIRFYITDDMKKGFNEHIYNFPFDNNIVDANNILDVHI